MKIKGRQNKEPRMNNKMMWEVSKDIQNYAVSSLVESVDVALLFGFVRKSKSDFQSNNIHFEFDN